MKDKLLVIYKILNLKFRSLLLYLKKYMVKFKQPSYLIYCYLGVCLLVCGLVILSVFFIRDSNYNKTRYELISKDVSTVSIQQPDSEFIEGMLPIDNKQSVYGNKDCFMFQYKTKNTKNSDCYVVSVYIQPLTNILEQRVCNNFGIVTTDCMEISMAVESKNEECEELIDLLSFTKSEIKRVERLENYLINDKVFESYKLDNQFYMVGQLNENYCFIYHIVINNENLFQNFNQMFYISIDNDEL